MSFTGAARHLRMRYRWRRAEAIRTPPARARRSHLTEPSGWPPTDCVDPAALRQYIRKMRCKPAKTPARWLLSEGQPMRHAMRFPAVRSLAARLTRTLGLVLTGRVAHATTIAASAELGSVPATSGTGLSAVYDRLTQIPTTLSNAAQGATARCPHPPRPIRRRPSVSRAAPRRCRTGRRWRPISRPTTPGLSGSAMLGPSYATFIGALLILTAGMYSFDLYAAASAGRGDLLAVRRPGSRQFFTTRVVPGPQVVVHHAPQNVVRHFGMFTA